MNFFLTKVKKLVAELNAQNLEKTYHDVFYVAWEVAYELIGRQYEEKKKFDISKKEHSFQRLMYESKGFSDRSIPFSEWSNVAKAVLQVVKEYLESDTTQYEFLPSYDRIGEEFQKCWDRLSNDPRYAAQFRELMGH